MARKDEIVQEEMESSGPSAPGFLRVAWERKWLVLLGIVAGMGLGAFHFVQTTPIYQSTSQFLVVKKRPDALPWSGGDPRTAYLEDYLPTHQVLLRSPEIVRRAVQKGDLKSLKAFGGSQDPTEAIIDSLRVSREQSSGSQTSVLSISFMCSEPAECATVLNAVFESYKEFLDKTFRNVNEDTVKLITQAREVLETRLTKREEDYRSFRLQHPVLWRGRDGVNVLQDRLFSLEAKRSGLAIRQKEIEARIAFLEKAVRDGRSKGELLALIEDSNIKLVSYSPDSKPTDPLKVAKESFEEAMFELQLEERLLLEELGSDHPKVKSHRSRMEILRLKNARIMGTLKENAKEASKFAKVEVSPPNPIEVHVQKLKGELENTKIAEQALMSMLQEEQKEAQKQVNNEIQDDSYRTEISRNQQLFESIVKRLQEVDLLKEFGGYEVQRISPPGAGTKMAPKAFSVFFLAGLLGLVGGLGLAYLAEFSDQNFRTPEELRRRLGLPILGHIPFIPAKKDEQKNGAALDPCLCAYHKPKSREAEAFRVVRTALYFSSRAGGQKVIQVTSPDLGDGKTTLAANLAVSIAQAEKKVLLIDADFRRPRMHKIFKVSSETGLASVITGESTLEEAIQESAVPGLSILPCGPIPYNPSEILSLPQFSEILDELRKRYDYLIIDTPPLLAVTDPSVVATQVDGVYMTVRLSKNARPHAERAKEVLSTLGVKVAGIVVNSVDNDAFGKYGHYRYGYYGYGYSQYYADDSEKAVSQPASKAKNGHPKGDA